MLVIHFKHDQIGDFDWELPRDFTKNFNKRTKDQQRAWRQYIETTLQFQLLLLLCALSREGDEVIKAVNLIAQSNERLADILFPKK